MAVKKLLNTTFSPRSDYSTFTTPLLKFLLTAIRLPGVSISKNRGHRFPKMSGFILATGFVILTLAYSTTRNHLADVILVLHVIVVLFNFGALPVIWVGYFRGWAFVRNFYFRIIHLLLIGVVAIESLFDIMCPLTIWEDALRRSNGTGPQHPNGFIAYWLHELLFYDLPAWVFAVAYLLFFIIVAATFYWVRPQLPRFHRDRGGG